MSRVPAGEDADAALDGRMPGHAQYHRELPAPSATTWSGSTCVHYDELQRLQAGPGNRAAGMYDACQLARFDIVTREEFTAMQAQPSLGGFALYRTLIEGGVLYDTARSLARAVIFSDTGHSALDVLALPSSTRAHPFAWKGGLAWSTLAIEFADRHLVKVEADGSAEPAALEDGMLWPLRSALAEDLASARKLGIAGAEPAAPLAIDRELRWRALAPGLAAAAAAGWPRAQLVALRADPIAPVGAVTVSLSVRNAVAVAVVGERSSTVRCGAASDAVPLLPAPSCVVAGATVELVVEPAARWQTVIDAVDALHPASVALRVTAAVRQ
ncbi:MAG: hypothetical protein U0168_03790 [Nannocystaceae bacterium]